MQYDKTKDGWTISKDVPFDLPAGGFVPEIVDFLEPDEPDADGETVLLRAKKLNANLGQRHAEYLLNHQELIPKECRKNVLLFPGTIWLDQDGFHMVPYLEWDKGQWRLLWDWILGVGGHTRLVRIRT